MSVVSVEGFRFWVTDIPSWNLSSGGGLQGVLVVRPGGGLVVEGAGLEAAVQDADEPVGELAQGGVVAGAPAARRVVVGAGAGRGAQRGEGLQCSASMSRSL